MKKEVVKKTLAFLVAAIAETSTFKGCGMSKAFLLPKNKERRATHIEVCKKLNEISTSNSNFPMSLLVYFAVGKNAHRLPVFQEGYTSIDEKKTTTILAWLKLFAKHCENPSLARNANVAHALTRVYENHTTSTKKFKAMLANCPKQKSWSNLSEVVAALGVPKEKATEVAAEETAAVAVAVEA